MTTATDTGETPWEPASPDEQIRELKDLVARDASPEQDGVKHFGATRKPIRFRVGSDQRVYEAAETIPAGLMRELLAAFESVQNTEASKAADKLDMVTAVLEKILYPDSLEDFKSRLTDITRPIGFMDVVRLVSYMVTEAYSSDVNPTSTPSPSFTGSMTAASSGDSSGAGASPSESTPTDSPGATSST